MPAYSVREWEVVPHGDGEGCIPPHLAQRLVVLAKTSRFAGTGGGVLEDRRHDLRARGVVGVLAVPGCTLEILPKIDVGEKEGSAQETREIRKRLVHMLGVALDLKIETGRLTDLDWQSETLLEILIRIFCDKLTDAVRRGMPRRYTQHEGDLPALRGTLDIPRQFTRHIANPGRLACRYDELSEDIALNRIMKATIGHLARMSRNVANVQRLRELAFVYADVTEVSVSALRWDDVVIDRTNRAWRELFNIAQLFLRNRYQTTSTGSGQGSALLFEMNALFEDYIGRLVTKALAGSDLRVALQGGRLFCLKSLDDERGVFQTKPDILIWRADQVVHVIDAKWKRISDRIDDRKQGVSQADIYQMMAYAHLYKAPRLTLLYPHHAGLGANEGIRARFKVTGQETVLETASFDISNGTDPVRRIMTRILSNLTEPLLEVRSLAKAGEDA
jgi:5-methylcytosine-specific restriction enzyme subunit McrC